VCGKETNIVYHVQLTCNNLHYAPRAIVHHFHRSSPNSLRKQIYSYAVCHAAYHLRCLRKYHDHRSLFQLAWHLPVWFARNIRRGFAGKTKYPFSLVFLEIKGTAVGPFQYVTTKVRRWVREWVAKPQAAKKALPPGSIEMAPPTPPPPAPRRIVYDVDDPTKSVRAA